MVPNVPCGVESLSLSIPHKVLNNSVPNAPCGVESHEFIDCSFFSLGS